MLIFIIKYQHIFYKDAVLFFYPSVNRKMKKILSLKKISFSFCKLK